MDSPTQQELASDLGQEEKCPCRQFRKLESVLLRLQRDRQSQRQRNLSTIEHLLEENRELRAQLLRLR